jgi:ubiquinone biosynthesis protein
MRHLVGAADRFAGVERAPREAFGPQADALLAGRSREPLAVASIGQVHRATLPDGAAVNTYEEPPHG